MDLDAQLLRDEISNIYARVATHPEGNFHFHRGPAYAAEFLGYDSAELALLPAEATGSFAGIGNRTPSRPSRLAKLYWTSGVEPARTCCWPPAEWARKVGRSAWR